MITKLIIIIIIIGLALILNFLGIRICPFFNLFHIPCVGCGITRSIKLIFKGEILESFKYNILPIPLLFLILIYCILYLINKDKLHKYIDKYKWLIITISFVIMIIVWIININNELLY